MDEQIQRICFWPNYTSKNRIVKAIIECQKADPETWYSRAIKRVFANTGMFSHEFEIKSMCKSIQIDRPYYSLKASKEKRSM